jgi:hypothetical protein
MIVGMNVSGNLPSDRVSQTVTLRSPRSREELTIGSCTIPTLNGIDLYELETGIQTALGALGEIDRWYDTERNLLLSYPEPIRPRLADDLDKRHARNREPYVRHLAYLYQLIVSTQMFANSTFSEDQITGLSQPPLAAPEGSRLIGNPVSQIPPSQAAFYLKDSGGQLLECHGRDNGPSCLDTAAPSGFLLYHQECLERRSTKS